MEDAKICADPQHHRLPLGVQLFNANSCPKPQYLQLTPSNTTEFCQGRAYDAAA
jgi:hypothetical protein